MDYDRYFGALAGWSEREFSTLIEKHHHVSYLTNGFNSEDPEIVELIEWRASQLTSEDREFARPFLRSELIAHLSEDTRAAIFLIAREITEEQQQQELARTLRLYSVAQDPVFESDPTIQSEVEKKNEMVSIANLRQSDRSGAFVRQRKRGRLNPVDLKLTSYVNPEIVNFITRNSPANTKILVRIDPDYPRFGTQLPVASYTQELPQMFLRILELVPFGVLLQAREWNLQKPEAICDDPNGAMHYSQGIRSLQMHRVNHIDFVDGYLEEIVDQSEIKINTTDGKIQTKYKGPVLGRMIHFDTRSTDDTLCGEVELMHLDLAINIYRGDVGRKRLETPMTTRVEASERIHVLKAVPLPLRLLPGIAYLFLWRSIPLVAREISNFSE
jgi:hypothetical protein